MATKKPPRGLAGAGPLGVRILLERASAGEQTTLERLESELGDTPRYDLVAALKVLEKAGAGRFVAGSKRNRPHFVWRDERKLEALRREARREGERAPSTRSAQVRARLVPQTAARSRADAQVSKVALLEHAFHVRRGVLVTLRLPQDVTRAEIQRLCQFLQTIPFV